MDGHSAGFWSFFTVKPMLRLRLSRSVVVSADHAAFLT